MGDGNIKLNHTVIIVFIPFNVYC